MDLQAWQRRHVVMGVGLSALSLTIALSLSAGRADAADPEVELKRLQQQAEKSMAYGDPQGAAARIGRAALKASLLARQQTDSEHRRFYEGLESLFRVQENTYRALGLFRQAGGHPPASSGVCETLSLADQFAQKADGQFQNMTSSATTQGLGPYDRYHQDVQEWQATLDEMHEEFQCP